MDEDIESYLVGDYNLLEVIAQYYHNYNKNSEVNSILFGANFEEI
jgi:hypothetical protein